MKAHQLQSTPHRQARRIGRGIAAGQGKTAGRGTKGQKSRAGSSRRPGFGGGQNPLMQQLPKLPGFRSIRPKAEIVHTNQLAQLGAVVDNHTLFAAGLISSPYARVKLLQRGDDVPKKIAVKVQAASMAAQMTIKKAGGSFEQTAQVKRAAKSK